MWRTDPYIIANYLTKERLPTWILFFPAEPEKDKKKVIAVGHGTNRNNPQGPCLEPKKMLEFLMGKSIWKEVDGKMKFFGCEYEPPGWFYRQCEAAGCLWFYSMVERMAAGEEISIEEIQAAYRENNEGRELEQKPINTLL